METKNQLKSFFTDHWTYMAVSTACKLNLFDNLQEAKTAKQLANELSLNEEKLLLLLNALHNADYLDKNADFSRSIHYRNFSQKTILKV
jgi:C-methyltransferase